MLPMHLTCLLNCLRALTIYHGNELCKYANDTYIIVPASNVNTITAELKNITDWACDHKQPFLSLSKSEEIVFIDKEGNPITKLLKH